MSATPPIWPPTPQNCARPELPKCPTSAKPRNWRNRGVTPRIRELAELALPRGGGGQTQELGCFWGRPQKPRKSRNSAEFGGDSQKWLIPGGQTPRIGPNQGVRPPKTAQTDPKSPEKTPFRPKPTPKTSNSGVSDLRFRPKGGDT